jgi:hypothetical protein
VVAGIPGVILGYFLLIQPFHDKARRKRGEPLFRLRCVLFGHKWKVFSEPEDAELFLCVRCDYVSPFRSN